MIKELICIECPKGCRLSVGVENNKVAKVAGNECLKGEKYAVSEIEDPKRLLTAAVLTQGLSLKMVSVRTDKAIPKSKIFEAMAEIKKAKVDKPLRIGDRIIENLLGLGVNVVATRDVS